MYMKKLIILISTVLISLNTYAQIPANGIIGYYPFNSNSLDLSGNNNNGVVTGATLTTDRFGNANSAYSFSGSNDITIANSTALTTETWSLSVWYLTTSTSGLSRLTTKQLTQNGSNTLSLIMGNGILYGSAYNGSTEIQMRDTQKTNDGNWHNAVYVRNTSSKKYYLYIDNILKDSIPDTFGNISNTGSLIIGKSVLNSQYWNGKVDNIRIYNYCRPINNSL